MNKKHCFGLQKFKSCSRGNSINRLFSCTDLFRSYQQIPAHEGDIPKTAIVTPFGLFEFPFMTFDTSYASQTFQLFMNIVLSRSDFTFCFF